jgi:hypothetical protein
MKYQDFDSIQWPEYPAPRPGDVTEAQVDAVLHASHKAAQKHMDIADDLEAEIRKICNP